MKRTLLIDGDIIVYQQAAIHEKEIDWGDGCEPCTLTFDAQAKKAALDQVERYKERLKATDVIVCVSDRKRNWRKVVMPDYKSNRKDTKRPVMLSEIREVLEERVEVLEYPWLEADDLMGLLSTDKKMIQGERIIVSIDKDMQTVPGKLYNPTKDTLRDISREEADFFFYKQVLMGDPIDGYFGIRGVGPKTAEKILLEAPGGQYWKAIVQAYVDRGLTEKDALVTARVARIIQAGEYDSKRKEVILWKPPK